MTTIQFELERMYDLVKETQEHKDKLQTEIDNMIVELQETNRALLSANNTIETKCNQFESVLNNIRSHHEEIRGRLANENYALNHRIECLMEVNRTTYQYLTNLRKENKELAKQIDTLTDGTIKYKRTIDPDDLEEYTVGPKIYLRDTLTDAIYTRHGKLIGYIHEDSGEFIKILKS
jgi:hypothetical protein